MMAGAVRIEHMQRHRVPRTMAVLSFYSLFLKWPIITVSHTNQLCYKRGFGRGWNVTFRKLGDLGLVRLSAVCARCHCQLDGIKTG